MNYFSTLPTLPQFSLINVAAALLGYASLPAFRVLRTLRGLRPLRAMSRLQGMKVSPKQRDY